MEFITIITDTLVAIVEHIAAFITGGVGIFDLSAESLSSTETTTAAAS